MWNKKRTHFVILGYFFNLFYVFVSQCYTDINTILIIKEALLFLCKENCCARVTSLVIKTVGVSFFNICLVYWPVRQCLMLWIFNVFCAFLKIKKCFVKDFSICIFLSFKCLSIFRVR